MDQERDIFGDFKATVTLNRENGQCVETRESEIFGKRDLLVRMF